MQKKSMAARAPKAAIKKASKAPWVSKAATKKTKTVQV